MAGVYVFGRFELRADERALLDQGQPVRLGGRAFDILLALVQRRDRLVEFDELLDVVWPGLAVEENNLAVQISGLRKALGAEVITTVRGRGYRFTAAVHEPEADPAPVRLPTGVGPAVACPPVGDDGPSAPVTVDLAGEPRPSIGILPFSLLGVPDDGDLLGEALADDLIGRLSAWSEFQIISGLSSRRLGRAGFPVDRAADLLAVDYLVVGSYRKASSAVHVQVQLQDARHGAVLKATRVEAPLDFVFDDEGGVGRHIAIEVARALCVHVERRALASPGAIGEPRAAHRCDGADASQFQVGVRQGAGLARGPGASARVCRHGVGLACQVACAACRARLVRSTSVRRRPRTRLR